MQIRDRDAKNVAGILDKAGVAYGFIGKPALAGKDVYKRQTKYNDLRGP